MKPEEILIPDTVNIMIVLILNILAILRLFIPISSGWSVRRGARGDRAKGSADARQSSPRGHSTGQGDHIFTRPIGWAQSIRESGIGLTDYVSDHVRHHFEDDHYLCS